jgi:hypothetical protein
MRAYLDAVISVFRPHARQPLTVGLASARWLSLVDGLELDEAQVHWYETLDPVATLARPVESLGLGRPVVLGEFPTRGASLSPATILQIARDAGYAQALAWSARAEDSATDPEACHHALRQWLGRSGPDVRQA